jgi:hypothetical protein
VFCACVATALLAASASAIGTTVGITTACDDATLPACAKAAVLLVSAGAMFAKYIQPLSVQPMDATVISVLTPARDWAGRFVCLAMSTSPFVVIVLDLLVVMMIVLFSCERVLLRRVCRCDLSSCGLRLRSDAYQPAGGKQHEGCDAGGDEIGNSLAHDWFRSSYVLMIPCDKRNVHFFRNCAETMWNVLAMRVV